MVAAPREIMIISLYQPFAHYAKRIVIFAINMYV
jgi:hypothetical protein